ncbi:hypothetical protein C7974DRAFT_314082 [Boeremia exigua]|uniref:uncharacterized protein n=1 Tax=Boeremia exigua TaxID=749465 RepID=UPI001E8CFDCD|nr:uncharacterized protein C7974DRAFT_314082 [Boeremia exigua]KAH6621745.1 hypothetical protein C7974DRAFT_314082 [Boeremia exigua]
MPAQKPSPHRFIAPNPATHTPKPKPASNLRHAVSAHTPTAIPALQFKKITPAKRFVVAPTQRQHGDATPRPDRVEEPDSSASTDYTPRPRQRKLGRVESIEEASQSSPSRPAEDVHVLHTIEYEGGEEDEEEAATTPRDTDDDDEILFPEAKRRRISTPPSLRHSPPPDTPLPNAPLRFRFPPPHPTVLPDAPTTPAPARPSFLRPPQPAIAQPPRPLPELFSPSRKAHRYVPGGLASTLQTWLIEAAAGATSGRGVARLSSTPWATERPRDDGVRFAVRVASLRTGTAAHMQTQTEAHCPPSTLLFIAGPTQSTSTVTEDAEDAEQVQEIRKVLLTAQPTTRNASTAPIKIRVGSVIGVRAPTWDIVVGGETWGVGVEWAVLVP